MVCECLQPSDILTRKAFETAIVAASSLGASTNCPPATNGIARHNGGKLDNADWDRVGYDTPLLVNCMPAGQYLGEAFHRAGGVPTVMAELLAKKKGHGDALTVTGKTMAENLKGAKPADGEVIKTYDKPMLGQAGFAVLTGNLFDSAIMKTSVISPEFRKKYLERKGDPDAFEGTAIVFDGPEDYHHRINDPKLPIDENSILFIRNAGPVGYPGSAEVVNMLPPDRLVKGGVLLLPCVRDGRQSGTSASPSILNASPDAPVGCPMAVLETRDKGRIHIGKRPADILISDAELAKRKAAWKPHVKESQTPWQDLQRKFIGQLASGACLDFAVNYQKIAAAKGVPRHSH